MDADRAAGLLGNRGSGPVHHGLRSGARGAKGAGPGAAHARRHGPGRGERGVRGPVPRGGAGAGARPRAHQRGRRRRGDRPSARRHRRADHGAPAARASPPRRALWTRQRLHRRRAGRRRHRRSHLSGGLIMEFGLIALAAAVAYTFASIRVIRQYDRAVTFFLGRFSGTKGPGLIFLPAFFAGMKRVSLRIVAMDIPPQDVITRDNVSVRVNAVLYMRASDPERVIMEVEDYLYATSQLAQTTLRSVLGEVELDELLSDREKINAVLKRIIDERTDAWGIHVS